MPSQYQRRISPSLDAELKRLKVGTVLEKQRYQNALVAMKRVMSDPIHPEFRKTLPQNFKAVDVLQQTRLFFRIIPAADATDVGTDVVFFVWMNGDDAVHRSGANDDAYQIFRKKLDQGEIDPYVLDTSPAPAREQFKIHDPWGADFVYVSFSRVLNGGNQHSDSHLILQKTIGADYRIDSITVSDEGVGLATKLLRCLCDTCDQYRYNLTFELETNATNYGKSRHLLERFGFDFDDQVEKTEIWVRRARP